MHLFSGPFDELDLSVNTDMPTIVRAMARPDSGLEIRDRMWLKITIPNAFIGADVVDWLHSHVKGFIDRLASSICIVYFSFHSKTTLKSTRSIHLLQA